MPAKLPLVSIVTPSLNQGRFIGDTVESVLAQTYPEIEYIVLDAGSTDETHDVLRTFGDKVKWRVAPDNGQADAINRGWKESRGEILAWLNADDLLEPDAVATAVSALRDNPSAGAIYGDATFFEDDVAVPPSEHLVGPFNLWRLINIYDFIVQPAVFFRRSAVANVGWVDDSLKWGMDWDLLIRLGLDYPMVHVPERLARVRLHADTKTSTGGWPRFRELVSIMRRYADEKRPPAYWWEGLETGRHGLARRGRATAAMGLAFYKFLAKRTFLDVDQWFPDGWAGPSVQFLLPPGTGPVTLRGAVLRAAAPQTLTIRSGDRTWTETLAAGTFELRLPMAANRPNGGVGFKVTATKWTTRPHPTGWIRRVSYRLDAVGREGSDALDDVEAVRDMTHGVVAP